MALAGNRIPALMAFKEERDRTQELLRRLNQLKESL
jgi:hypothetical protein